MNSKNLKKLRKQCREVAALAGAAQRSLVASTPSVQVVPDYSQPLNLDGTLQMKPFFITGTLRNAPMTERAFYRRMKAGKVPG